jgi:adenylyl- and sulfurtransferase ThiI
VVEGMEPLKVAALLKNTPGVGWIAAGLVSKSFKGLLEDSATLARVYLKPGFKFSVEADGSVGATKSDVEGALTSRILESAKGSRVSQGSPKVRFRSAFDGQRGVIGVEIASGPGGVPTGVNAAVCLVSGGRHSSVVAWMALLAGFSVRLVHVLVNEESLLGAARLYSELSHRTDPRKLTLQVAEGRSLTGVLVGIVRGVNEPVFGGFQPTGVPIPRPLKGRVLAPLYLLAEERFSAEFDSLGLRSHEAKGSWDAGKDEDRRVRSFGGVTADVSEVVDRLA